MKKKQFLILSDLHYRENWDEEIGPVFDALLVDIKTEIDPKDENYLIFCGDLVQSGNDANLFDHLNRSLSEPLSSLGITRERRFVVAGNHDIQRSIIEDSFLTHKGCLSLVTGQLLFNDSFSSQLVKTLSPKFEHFNKFLGEFTSNIPKDLSGGGFDIDDNTSIYCLNSALTSFGGIEDPLTKKLISDERALMVETRKIIRWIGSNKARFRILVIYHPLDWLCEWARNELEEIIEANFDLVISGHVHKPSSIHISGLSGSSARLSCPPLFTRKHESLGYSILSIPSDEQDNSIKFKQWVAPKHYVLGTSFSKNDTGIVTLKPHSQIQVTARVEAPKEKSGASLHLLKKGFPRRLLVIPHTAAHGWKEIYLEIAKTAVQNKQMF